MIVKGGFVHVAFALIKRITIDTSHFTLLHRSFYSFPATLRYAIEVDSHFI